MKRFLGYIVILSLCFSNLIYAPVGAATPTSVTVEDAVKYANEQIESKYGIVKYYDITKVNKAVYNTYKILVYGSPHGTLKEGEYRYIGTAPLTSDDVPNPEYIYDSKSNTFFDDMIWKADPFKDAEVTKAFPTVQIGYFNNNLDRAAIKKNFIEGMFKQHKAYFRNTPLPWERYMHVILPPTDYSRGISRIFHKSNGRIWYIDVILVSHKEVHQLMVHSHINAPDAVPISHLTTSGTFHFSINSSEELQNYTIKNMRNATTTTSLTHTFSGGETKFEGSIPITINFPTGSNTVNISITIEGVDKKNRYAEHTSTHTITRVAPTTSNFTLPSDGASIASMPRGAELFDVSQGIPTNESLYIEVTTPEYIVELKTFHHSGVYKEYRTIGTPPNITLEHRHYPYSYYTIEKLEVFGIDHAKVTNYALPNGFQIVTPEASSYMLPTVTIVQNGGRKDRKVKNDTLIINGITILDGAVYTDTAPAPADYTIPNTNPNALFKENIIIQSTLANKKESSSTTDVYYTLIKGIHPTKKSVIRTIPTNPVTVHTPVCCKGSIINDKDFDQDPTPDTTRASVILGKSTEILLETTGTHQSIPGYGTRNYKNYASKKQVRFPFDVYMNTTYREADKYLKAGTWCDIPLDIDSVPIYVPIWVNEGNYSIDYRTLALNNAYGGEEVNANIDLTHTIATDQVSVKVIGRLYGFHITDIQNYPLWENVFRVTKDSHEHTGNHYTIGNKNENGLTSGVEEPYTLPILNGSHPTKNNQGALPTGYSFSFELTTIGDYTKSFDCISITPRFYYVPEDGSSRQEVDLYYHENIEGKTHYFVKMDNNPHNRNNEKYAVLGQPSRTIGKEEIENTATALGILPQTFKSQKTKIGYTDWLVLSEPLRTFIGDTTNLPSNVNKAVVLKQKQKWYGQYYLPNDLYAVPKGFDIIDYARTENGLDGKETFWLKEGYIIVNFYIEAYKDAKNKGFINPELRYYDTPNASMWQIEGFVDTKTDSNGNAFSLQEGDIIFYSTNKKATDDYTIHGTH